MAWLSDGSITKRALRDKFGKALAEVLEFAAISIGTFSDKPENDTGDKTK